MVRTAIFTRWLVKTDLPFLGRIDKEVFSDPWSMKDFFKVLRVPSMRIQVVGIEHRREQELVGYIVYRFRKKLFVVYRVAAIRQREGFGGLLLDCVKKKLSRERRDRIEVNVPEENLGAQLFFRESGFRWVRTDCFEGMDYYNMIYSLPSFVEQKRFGFLETNGKRR